MLSVTPPTWDDTKQHMCRKRRVHPCEGYVRRLAVLFGFGFNVGINVTATVDDKSNTGSNTAPDADDASIGKNSRNNDDSIVRAMWRQHQQQQQQQ